MKLTHIWAGRALFVAATATLLSGIAKRTIYGKVKHPQQGKYPDEWPGLVVFYGKARS